MTKNLFFGNLYTYKNIHTIYYVCNYFLGSLNIIIII